MKHLAKWRIPNDTQITFIFHWAQHILKPSTFTITFSFHSSVDGKQIKWFMRTFYSFSFVNSWRFLYYKQTVHSVSILLRTYQPFLALHHRKALLIKHLTHFYFSISVTHNFGFSRRKVTTDDACRISYIVLCNAE